MRRVLRRLLIALLSATMLLAASLLSAGVRPPVARAHSFVIGSDPVDGSLVSAPPKVVRIFFDAPISTASFARVYAPAPGGGLRLVDTVHSSIAPGSARELDTPLIAPERLPQGGYLVRWVALSTVDGHATQGTIGFDVGRSSMGLPGEVILGPSTSNILPDLDLLGLVSVAWEWLVLLALTLWVGILAGEGLLARRNQHELLSAALTQVRARTRPLQRLCLFIMLIGELVALVLRTIRLTALGDSGGGLDPRALAHLVFQTDYGHLWLLRVALLVLAMGLLWRTERAASSKRVFQQAGRTRGRFGRFREAVAQEHGLAKAAVGTEAGKQRRVLPPPSWSGAFWFALVALLLLSLALSREAAQVAQPHVSAILFDWLYLLTRSAWLGGVAYVGYVLLPLLTKAEPASASKTLALLMQRGRPWLVGALVVLLLSGFFVSEATLSQAAQLLTDPYGRALLVTWVLLALLLVLSLAVLLGWGPRLTQQATKQPGTTAGEAGAPSSASSAQPVLGKTGRSVQLALRVQSWLGAAVLLCAALMAFFAPPIVFPAGSYATRSTSAAVASTAGPVQTQQVADLAITVQVLPARVNAANTVVATISERQSGTLVTDAQVQFTTNMEVMDMGTTRVTLGRGAPTYVATFAKQAAFSMPGVWDLTVTVGRQKHAPVQAVFQITAQA